MTPYEELVAGDSMGPSMYALLIELARASASARNYPAPAGHQYWTDDAARQWLHDYFFPAKGPDIALKFEVTAVDDATLIMVARKAILNALIDEARTTTAGRMKARLETMLPRAGFIDAKDVYAGTKGWTLPELEDRIFHGDWMDLLRDPRLKGIPPIESLPTQGTTSRANIASIVQAVRGLLLAANGAMRDRDIANAVVFLFELDDPTLYALRDADQDPFRDELDGLSPDDDIRTENDEAEDTPTGDFADSAHIREDAERIWAALTDDERVLIGVLEHPAAIWTQALPGRSDAAKLAKTLKAKLVALLLEQDSTPGALGFVIARSLSSPR